MNRWMSGWTDRHKDLHFKELAHRTIEASKSEVYRTGQGAGKSQAETEADAVVLRQNLFFFQEILGLPSRPFN